jgi:hypothetical protein
MKRPFPKLPTLNTSFPFLHGPRIVEVGNASPPSPPSPPLCEEQTQIAVVYHKDPSTYAYMTLVGSLNDGFFTGTVEQEDIDYALTIELFWGEEYQVWSVNVYHDGSLVVTIPPPDLQGDERCNPMGFYFYDTTEGLGVEALYFGPYAP